MAQAVADSIPSAVAVDPWEALHLAKAGIPLGHVGHLVQIPSSMVEAILDYQPEVITVFSLEKAREISEAARARHYRQDLLLKVTGEGDYVYEGQWGGFREKEWISAAREIEALPGVRIAGVTAFPCLLYDGKETVPTPNFETLIRAKRTLEEGLDRPLDQINAPSATSCASLSSAEIHGSYTWRTWTRFDGDHSLTPAPRSTGATCHRLYQRGFPSRGGRRLCLRRRSLSSLPDATGPDRAQLGRDDEPESSHDGIGTGSPSIIPSDSVWERCRWKWAKPSCSLFGPRFLSPAAKSPWYRGYKQEDLRSRGSIITWESHFVERRSMG